VEEYLDLDSHALAQLDRARQATAVTADTHVQRSSVLGDVRPHGPPVCFNIPEYKTVLDNGGRQAAIALREA
jgi:hypothetical protein